MDSSQAYLLDVNGIFLLKTIEITNKFHLLMEKDNKRCHYMILNIVKRHSFQKLTFPTESTIIESP